MSGKAPKVLVVDDEPNFLRSLNDALKLEGFDVFTCLRPREALNRLEEGKFDLVITDLRMPEMSGMELLRRIKEKWPGIGVFVLTAYGSIGDAVECMKHGAENYILKPVNIHDLIVQLRGAATRQQKDSPGGTGTVSEVEMPLIGQSKTMRNIRDLIGKIAPSDLSIVILGESGTGKELVAHALYRDSNRNNKPFMKINCAALPDHLLESELFGYEPGAFTDAKKLKRGKLELAHSGTLFLDEIGDMPFPMQAKLLRALEERSVERLGGNQPVKTDFRLISATNQNLQSKIRQGDFREDLYFRINAFQIKLAPLRELQDDIPLLTEYFLQQFAISQGINPPSVDPRAMELLGSYHWPGNVRELRNTIHRSVVLSAGRKILPEHLPEHLSLNSPPRIQKSDVQLSLEEVERQHISKVLEIAGGNKNRTASILNIHRDTLYRKLRKYELE